MNKRQDKLLQFRQPYWVMANRNYFKHSVMREGIDHFYSFVADGEKETMISVPDGCIDLSFCCDEEDPGIYLLGSVSRGTPASRKKGARYFGVRFLPGYFCSFGEVATGGLRDRNVNLLEEIPKLSDLEAVFWAGDFTGQIAVFMEQFRLGTLAKAMRREENSLFQTVLHAIVARRGQVDMETLAEISNYSQRRIRSVFTEQMGMGIKAFCDIVRFQSLLDELMDLQGQARISLSRLSVETGYFDQAHMCREFKKNALNPPKKYVQKLQTVQYDTLIRAV